MKRAIAKRWVAALRSGKYKQGRDYLRQGDRYCCLGVLCAISKLAEWNHWRDDIFTYMSSDGTIPDKVQEWSGIKSGTADLGFDSVDSLAAINDDGKRFSTIAKVIEEHWKEL